MNTLQKLQKQLAELTALYDRERAQMSIGGFNDIKDKRLRDLSKRIDKKRNQIQKMQRGF